MTGILSLFATVITFSRHEVSVLLLGEQSLLVLAGIPAGWLLGFGLSASLGFDRCAENAGVAP